MRQNDDVFRLIKSLTKSEKRFFKLFSSLTHGDKNHLKLFDAIERQKTYDESAIREKFSDKKFIRHLPAVKIYLQKMIMRSLRSFHSESTVDLQTGMLNIDAEILVNKYLLAQAERSSRKALAISEANDKLLIANQALHYLDTVYTYKPVSAEMYREWNALLEKQKAIQRSILNITEIRQMSNRLFYLSKRFGQTRGNIDANELKQMLKHPLLSPRANLATSNELIRQVILKANIWYLLGDVEKEAEMRCEAMKLYERLIMEGKAVNFKNIIGNLTNYINCRIELKQFSGLEGLFAKYKKLKRDAPENTQAYLAEIEQRDRIKYYCAEENGEQGLKMGVQLGALDPSSEYELQAKYYYAYLLFKVRHYKESVKVLNDILKFEKRFSLDYFFIASRVLVLMNYFEMKDFELLHHRAISTMRKLKGDNKLYEFEKVLLNFFINHPDGDALKFTRLKNKLNKILSDKKEGSAIQELNIMAWLKTGS